MNKKQKYVLAIGIILIAAALLYWTTQGAEILTKTQVLVDKTSDLDKMLGVKNEQYIDKFVLGLDYTGGFSAIIAALTTIFIYLFRNKRKETK
jgi:ABC-type antimicrobial peptide transport system permease subunit